MTELNLEQLQSLYPNVKRPEPLPIGEQALLARLAIISEDLRNNGCNYDTIDKLISIFKELKALRPDTIASSRSEALVQTMGAIMDPRTDQNTLLYVAYRLQEAGALLEMRDTIKSSVFLNDPSLEQRIGPVFTAMLESGHIQELTDFGRSIYRPQFRAAIKVLENGLYGSNATTKNISDALNSIASNANPEAGTLARSALESYKNRNAMANIVGPPVSGPNTKKNNKPGTITG